MTPTEIRVIQQLARSLQEAVRCIEQLAQPQRSDNCACGFDPCQCRRIFSEPEDDEYAHDLD